MTLPHLAAWRPGHRGVHLVGSATATTPADGYIGPIGSTLVVPIPAGAIAGDLLLAFVTTAAGVPTPGGWTQVTTDGFPAFAYLYSRTMQSGDTDLTISGYGDAPYSGVAFAVRGASPVSPFGQTISQSVISQSGLYLPDFAATRPRALLVAACFNIAFIGSPVAQTGTAEGGLTADIGHWDYFGAPTQVEHGWIGAHEYLNDVATKSGRYFTQSPAGAHGILGVVVQP